MSSGAWQPAFWATAALLGESMESGPVVPEDEEAPPDRASAVELGSPTRGVRARAMAREAVGLALALDGEALS